MKRKKLKPHDYTADVIEELLPALGGYNNPYRCFMAERPMEHLDTLYDIISDPTGELLRLVPRDGLDCILRNFGDDECHYGYQWLFDCRIKKELMEDDPWRHPDPAMDSKAGKATLLKEVDARDEALHLDLSISLDDGAEDLYTQ